MKRFISTLALPALVVIGVLVVSSVYIVDVRERALSDVRAADAAMREPDHE